MFMNFPKKGTDHRCIIFLKDRDIHESEVQLKSPEALRRTYKCCLKLCKCSGKDQSALSVKIAQIVSKITT